MLDRTQKRCLIGSLLVHLLLIGILVLGPAFIPARQRIPDTFELIEFIPLRTTDRMDAGGGEPDAAPVKPVAPAPPAPLPQQPRPPVPPQTETQLAPPQQQPPRAVTGPEPVTEPVQPKKRIPQISTNLVTRTLPRTPVRNSQQPRTQTEDELLARDAATIASRLRRVLDRGPAGTSLREGSRSGPAGPGGGGLSYANFDTAVRSIYYNAWHPPAAISNENAVTRAEVVVARDGTVISARIVSPSGEPAMDASVRQVLERVKHLVPLPEESTETQRTLRIVFDLKAKRESG